MVTLLLFYSAIFYFTLVDIEKFAEISNLSKLPQALCLCGFDDLSFLRIICVDHPENDGFGVSTI